MARHEKTGQSREQEPQEDGRIRKKVPQQSSDKTKASDGGTGLSAHGVSDRDDMNELDSIVSGFPTPEEILPLAQKLSQPGYETLKAELFTRLQQAYGNKYVQKVAEAIASAEAQAQQHASKPQVAKPDTTSQRREGIRTVLRPGYAPEVITGVTPNEESAKNQPAHGIVVPGGTPNVVEPGGENTCTPDDIELAALDWGVVSEGEDWKPNVRSLTLSGTINIEPWANQPNAMVVPNTPNPVDGGNINNDPTSRNYWQFVVDDLADYNTAGTGGAGRYWHSTEASRAHEWAHWNTDWMLDAVLGSGGGDWLVANLQIEEMRVSKEDSGDSAADGKTALEPQVEQRIEQVDTDATARWNALEDEPGAAGGSGYRAGMEVLNGIIADVRSYGATLQAQQRPRGILGRIGAFFRSLF